MPRVTSADYLRARIDLLADWRAKIPVLAHLSLTEQRILHDYFAFTRRLTETEALAHRKAVTVADRSLPYRAGRTMKRFLVLSSIDWKAEARRHPMAVGRGDSRRLAVRAVLRPEPDLDPDR